MRNTATEIDNEPESIKAKLWLFLITVSLGVIVFVLGLPMWVAAPGIGIGTIVVWYVAIKFQESKKLQRGKP